jgi:hypothetical protein
MVLLQAFKDGMWLLTKYRLLFVTVLTVVIATQYVVVLQLPPGLRDTFRAHTWMEPITGAHCNQCPRRSFYLNLIGCPANHPATYETPCKLSPHSSLDLLADFGVLLCAVALIYFKKQLTGLGGTQHRPTECSFSFTLDDNMNLPPSKWHTFSKNTRNGNNNNKHAYAGTDYCCTHLRVLLVLQSPRHRA